MTGAGAATTASVQRPLPVHARIRLRPHATTSGMLLASAAAPIAIVHYTRGSILTASPSLQGVAAIAVASLLIAGAVITSRPRLGRYAATLGIIGGVGLGSKYLVTAPLVTLTAAIASTTALALLWKVGAPLIGLTRIPRRPRYEGQANGAGVMASALWLLWTFLDVGGSPIDSIVVGWSLLVSVLLGLEWSLRNLKTKTYRAAALLASIIGGLVAAVSLWGEGWWMLSCFSGTAILSAVLIRQAPRLEFEQTSWWEPLLGHPERLFVGTFAALCFGGTVLLALPQSSAKGASIGFIDALFTATSAVCVTGLTVLDTPTDFSRVGQVFILLLIQVGGLGIMTFSTAVLWALGRRLSLRHEGAVASLISAQDRGRLFATAKKIIMMTALAEGVGTIILTGAFIQHGDSFGRALWRGLFTSISAFCNAGFALQTNNLLPYQSEPIVLHVVGVLIILGGLSPLVVFSLPRLLMRSSEPVSAQARLALASAGVLLLGGFFFILTFEWSNALRGLSFMDRIHNAWFQSISLRTAGFNSVDLVDARASTITLMMLWMFIGGSPGGTAGGVKTTTIAVLVLSVFYAMRGQWTLDIFGKRIPDRTRTRAAVVVAVAVATGVIALVTIQLTQPMSTRLAAFEVVSALGTVGLSLGGTARLDGIGKTVILICMFVGRVGGLTLLMFLTSRRAPAALGRPEEEIDVG